MAAGILPLTSSPRCGCLSKNFPGLGVATAIVVPPLKRSLRHRRPSFGKHPQVLALVRGAATSSGILPLRRPSRSGRPPRMSSLLRRQDGGDRPSFDKVPRSGRLSKNSSRPKHREGGWRPSFEDIPQVRLRCCCCFGPRGRRRTSSVKSP